MNAALLIAGVGGLLAAAVVLTRSLPAQNVAFIIAFLAAVEAAVEYETGAGILQVGALFWPAAILGFRLAAQAFLKSRRHTRNYGLLLIGVTSGAVAALQLLFAPGLVVVIRFCLTAICLIVLTPWFIQKRVTTSEKSKK